MIEISQNGLYVTWINHYKVYKTFYKQKNAEMNVRTLDTPESAANVGRYNIGRLTPRKWISG